MRAGLKALLDGALQTHKTAATIMDAKNTFAILLEDAFNQGDRHAREKERKEREGLEARCKRLEKELKEAEAAGAAKGRANAVRDPKEEKRPAQGGGLPSAQQEGLGNAPQKQGGQEGQPQGQKPPVTPEVTPVATAAAAAAAAVKAL